MIQLLVWTHLFHPTTIKSINPSDQFIGRRLHGQMCCEQQTVSGGFSDCVCRINRNVTSPWGHRHTMTHNNWVNLTCQLMLNCSTRVCTLIFFLPFTIKVHGCCAVGVQRGITLLKCEVEDIVPFLLPSSSISHSGWLPLPDHRSSTGFFLLKRGFFLPTVACS